VKIEIMSTIYLLVCFVIILNKGEYNMSHRGMPVTQQRRSERRAQAEKRQQAYSALSVQEKLHKLPVSGAKRQRERLTAQLNKPTATTAPDVTEHSKSVPTTTVPDKPSRRQRKSDVEN
jgi:hypothetical protein